MDVGQGRRAHWDERHAAHEPIELIEIDPSLEEEVARLTPGRALDLGAATAGTPCGWRCAGGV